MSVGVARQVETLGGACDCVVDGGSVAAGVGVSDGAGVGASAPVGVAAAVDGSDGEPA